MKKVAIKNREGKIVDYIMMHWSKILQKYVTIPED